MKLISKNPTTTSKTAKLLAEEILKTKPTKPIIIALTGDLGSGKTTFIKGFMKGIGVKKKIISPTFVILRRFPFKKGRDVYHIDAYRVINKDLISLGFKKILQSPNIILIEWADRVKKLLPKGIIEIKFKHGQEENERHITFNRR